MKISKSRKIQIAERFSTLISLGVMFLIAGSFSHIVTGTIKNSAVGKLTSALSVIFLVVGFLLFTGGFIASGIWGVITGYLVSTWAWWSRLEEKPEALSRVQGLLFILVGLFIAIFLLSLL